MWVCFVGSFLLFLAFVSRSMHQVFLRAVLFAIVMTVWSSSSFYQEGAVADCECLKKKLSPMPFSKAPATAPAPAPDPAPAVLDDDDDDAQVD